MSNAEPEEEHRDTHAVGLRDLRRRVADTRQYAAECSCGWRGPTRYGASAERVAQRDGTLHTDEARIWRTPER
jgi:hypothetical protein